MNRRRQDIQKRISSFAIFAFVLAGAIGAIGGITHVVYRNAQIKSLREIDLVERRIEQHQLDIRTVQMRKDQILNLFSMRTSLEQLGTNLRPIPAGMSENILPAERTAVASSETNL